jgi:hypothetical protein
LRGGRDYLQAYLAGEHLSQATSRFDDRAQNAALKTTVRLDLLVANEQDAGRRVEIEKARAEVFRSVVNPILAEKEATAPRLARELGYRS